MEKQFVVYTVMVGKYGEIHQPICVDERFDYVLFSNNFAESHVGIWQVRSIPIPYEIDRLDNKRLSRYPKAHPETMLSDYKASLYIDANIQIMDKWVYDRFINLVDRQINYAGVQLQLTGRDCIYRHAYDVCMVRAENDFNAITELHALYLEGFPEHYGLNENNVIFRMHTEAMKDVDTLWWQWIVNYSFRDQFSYMYCLWKYAIPLEYFLPKGEDARNSVHFRYYSHNNHSDVSKQKWVKCSLLERLRNICRSLSDYHKKYYELEWVCISKLPFPRICLVINGIIAVCVNLPLILVTKSLYYLNKYRQR